MVPEQGRLAANRIRNPASTPALWLSSTINLASTALLREAVPVLRSWTAEQEMQEGPEPYCESDDVNNTNRLFSKVLDSPDVDEKIIPVPHNQKGKQPVEDVVK